LGIGGGVLLVPLLVIGLGIPMHYAVGVSLTTVIATSSAVSGATAGRQLINLRLGMLLEVATAAGGLTGGLLAQSVSPTTLRYLFSAVTALVAAVTLTRIDRRNTLDAAVDPGRFGGRLFDADTRQVVTYRVKRLPLALAGSFVAGQLSTLLGIGGGTLKVPLLNAAACCSGDERVDDWCHGNVRRHRLLRRRLAAAGPCRGCRAWGLRRIRPRDEGWRAVVRSHAQDRAGDGPVSRVDLDAVPDVMTTTIERRIGVVLTLGSRVSTVLLAVGVLILLAVPSATIGSLFVHAGLIVVLVTPLARVVASLIGFAQKGDWLFVAMTLAVLGVLAGSIVAAIR
jgi:uncharacterized membrane protein